MHKFITFLFFVVLSYSGFAQTKYEKEIRIKVEDVPPAAKSYVDSLSFGNKVKWYQEFGIDKTTIEAKTIFQGMKYSIEFTNDGMLEDVEIEMNIDDLPKETQLKIIQYFKSKFLKFKVDKIQIQYSGNQKNILAYLKKQNLLEEININYEIVVTAKVDRTYKMYEYLFSQNGDFLKFAEIVQANTDNIEF